MMPLGPQTKNEDAAFNQACNRIDEAIQNGGSDRVTIAASLLPGMSWKTIDRLTAAYKQAGWRKVEMVSDQRDGDFFDLQA